MLLLCLSSYQYCYWNSCYISLHKITSPLPCAEPALTWYCCQLLYLCLLQIHKILLSISIITYLSHLFSVLSQLWHDNSAFLLTLHLQLEISQSHKSSSENYHILITLTVTLIIIFRIDIERIRRNALPCVIAPKGALLVTMHHLGVQKRHRLFTFSLSPRCSGTTVTQDSYYRQSIAQIEQCQVS